jgi:phosphate starvation-inducible membrane PsiE
MKLLRDFEQGIDRAGNLGVSLFHRLALFGIGAATAWAAGEKFITLFQAGTVTIPDLLLLFIYLEIGAMVGIYFKTNHMPVRFLLYIAITALTRHLIEVLSYSPMNLWDLASTGGTILVVSISVVVIRYASSKFPSRHGSHDPEIS